MDVSIEQAREFAIIAHGEQRYGDEPYASHLAAVVQIMDDFGLPAEFKVAGWLHDVVEDTEQPSQTSQKPSVIVSRIWCGP